MDKLIAILRIRGSMETRGTTERGLRNIHLTRKNHCVLLGYNLTLRGILLQCKDFITWGEVDEKTVVQLLTARGVLDGGIKLTDSEISKRSKYKSIAEFANALMGGSAKFSEVRGLKPLFRLHPPARGFGGIKTPYPKGALGFRKDGISGLIQKMV